MLDKSIMLSLGGKIERPSKLFDIILIFNIFQTNVFPHQDST